jgi:hypothetical protein
MHDCQNQSLSVPCPDEWTMCNWNPYHHKYSVIQVSSVSLIPFELDTLRNLNVDIVCRHLCLGIGLYEIQF